MNHRNRAPDILVPDTFSKFERDFAIKDVLTSLKDVHTVAEIKSRIGNSTEKAALLQTYLVAKGLLTAPQGETYAIDGIVGNATLTAIKNYRKSEAPRQEQATQAKTQREQNEKLNKKLEAGWNPSLEQIEDNAKGKGYSLDKTASKDPNVVLKKSAKITIKTQDGETVDESTSSQQLSVKINLNQFYDRKLNQSAFDAEVNKQFAAALNKEQTAQDKKNAEAVQNANTLKIKNEREKTLATNLENMITSVIGKSFNIKNSFTAFPTELNEYNAIYTGNRLSETALTHNYKKKFTS
ncbi:MAG: hypothetical protein LBG59_06845 [Candidatus Peribacteria bacterium]|nr:hypothetical protein [Candidatus Peribacteria bacterium]